MLPVISIRKRISVCSACVKREACVLELLVSVNEHIHCIVSGVVVTAEVAVEQRCRITEVDSLDSLIGE